MRMTIDRDWQSVWDGEREILLTDQQYQLLAFLVEHRGLHTPQELIQVLHPDEKWESGTNVVIRCAVHRLREKLGHDAIVTRSQGYGLRAELFE